MAASDYIPPPLMRKREIIELFVVMSSLIFGIFLGVAWHRDSIEFNCVEFGSLHIRDKVFMCKELIKQEKKLTLVKEF